MVMQRYLIIEEFEVWSTNWFNPENNYSEGMKVVDITKSLWYDGDKWQPIAEDRL